MEPEVEVLNPNQRGLKLVVVVLLEEEAAKLEELSHLKVGMTSKTSCQNLLKRCNRHYVINKRKLMNS